MFFNEGVAQFHVLANSDEEVIKIAADELYKRGIVKEDFYKNALKREREFPTGLDIGNYCVAIPHTDSEYVNRSQIEFLSLEKPVKFKNMANINEEVSVSYVFMMAMSQPHEQAETLTKLMEMFANEELMNKLYQCNSVEAYKDILRENDLL